MTITSTQLPGAGDRLFLTDGGIETSLIYHEGLELPHFAAFDLLRHEDGRAALKRYYRAYIDIARRYGCGFILESATWRASRDWGEKLGYSRKELLDTNRAAIDFLHALRRQSGLQHTIVSGCVGPRGDGYDAGSLMSEKQAEAYHAEQIGAFADAGADIVTAITMTNIPEAIGVVRAATGTGLPVVISFTVETDARLPSGDRLVEAIQQVDTETGGATLYFMVNCAHPSHFIDVLRDAGSWRARIGGIRANASRCSHEELDAMATLDDGDPLQLGAEYLDLAGLLPNLRVVGGCCGTDNRHIEAIARTLSPAYPMAV